MKIVERTITYELTPEEFESDALDKTIKDVIQEMNKVNPFWMQTWECVSHTKKSRMKFDANYNRFYAKVKYELTA